MSQIVCGVPLGFLIGHAEGSFSLRDLFTVTLSSRDFNEHECAAIQQSRRVW